MINAVNVGGKWGKKLLLGLLGAAAAFCMTGSAAHAQGKIQIFGGYAYGGASGNNDYYCDYTCTEGFARQGFAVSAAYNFSTHIGLEGEFDRFSGNETLYAQGAGYYEGETEKDNGSSYLYTFGPRLTYPVGSFALYTHVLVGGAHVHDNLADTCFPGTGEGCGSPNPETANISGNGMALKIGGGVDWNHGVWGIRIVQVDYIHSQLSLGGSDNEVYQPTFSSYGPSSSLQVAAGVIINLGSAK
jgi:opacity protein-like surface antigen